MTDPTGKCTISTGMLNAHFDGETMSVVYAGNMGSSMVDVDVDLQHLGLFPLSVMRDLPSFEESGHPDYLYKASVRLGDLTKPMRSRVETLLHKKAMETPSARHGHAHESSNEEIAMLRDIAEIAQAMKDTPTLATADPRYWVVQQHVWREVPNEQDGEPAVWDPNGVSLSSLEDFAEVWLEAYLEEYDGEETHEIQLGGGVKATLPDGGDWENAYDWKVEVTDRRRLVDDVRDGLAGNRYEIIYRDWEWQTVSDTLFLTLEACERHIRENAYHYDHPRSFCMHAWRSPDVARLWKALKGIDWDALANAIDERGPEQ